MSTRRAGERAGRRLRRERRVGRLTLFRARWWWTGTAVWALFFVWPLLPGWVFGQVFTTLEQQGAGPRLWWLLACLVVLEVVMATMLWWGDTIYAQGMVASESAIQLNVVRAQLASGGPEAGPRTLATGDVLARLRDDPSDVMLLGDNWVDLVGSLAYGSGAALLLARIDPLAAAVGIVPLLLLGFGNSLLGNVSRRLRQRARQASGEVSAFLTAVFAASLSVRLAGAQPDVLRRLAELNRRRARASVTDAVVGDAQFSANFSLTDVCIGLALIAAARTRLAAGEVTLFASYLVALVWLPFRLGGIVVGRRRFDVSAGRLDALLAAPDPRAQGAPGTPAATAAAVTPAGGVEPTPDRLTRLPAAPILGGPPVERPPAARRVSLERLDVVGLTVRGRGVDHVDLSVVRGALVVVAGAVGSGKTTLLRAIVGLVAADAGEVRWNGEVVADRAAFFVPPNCAYVAQVPRLFAESLGDNLRLGAALSDADLLAAVNLAAFGDDLSALPAGFDTLIGTRGVRLSGGQVQRAAAARALVHRPELVVIDDLSSALDIETELLLWQRLAGAGMTVLAASNRPAALHRADRVVHL
jgi:ATP-binding cassette subfamily B protein